MSNREPQTIIDKIWAEHVVSQTPGHPAVFAIDFMLVHEVTSAQAFDVLRAKKLPVKFPERLLATLDHSIPTSSNRLTIVDERARIQVEQLRQNAQEFGVTLYDFDSGKQGIVHVIGPEAGITQPGMTIVCGDSHTSTHGAFGALAFGVGTTEVGLVMATGCILQQKPKSMRVEFKGTLGEGVTTKDAILKLIATIGIGGANGHIIEYAGSAVQSWSMEERMTVCNMSIECGARAGLVAPDSVTLAYLKGRPAAPTGARWDEACAYWLSICSDPGAQFDKEVVIDLDTLEPMVTWGINPGQGMGIGGTVPELSALSGPELEAAKKAIDYVGLTPGEPIAGVPVQWAFVGSCTNGRIEDLRAVAAVLQGRRVHPEVTFYIVPGSEQVMKSAQQEGLVEIFKSAGADFRMPGCSMCLGMNEDKVPAGQRCISSSNRNFVGRQGTGSRTHLASPRTVAASAVAGFITAELTE